MYLCYIIHLAMYIAIEIISGYWKPSEFSHHAQAKIGLILLGLQSIARAQLFKTNDVVSLHR